MTCPPFPVFEADNYDVIVTVRETLAPDSPLVPITGAVCEAWANADGLDIAGAATIENVAASQVRVTFPAYTFVAPAGSAQLILTLAGKRRTVWAEDFRVHRSFRSEVIAPVPPVTASAALTIPVIGTGTATAQVNASGAVTIPVTATGGVSLIGGVLASAALTIPVSALGTAVVTALTVAIIFLMGNSHMGGRPVASGDAIADARVFEVNQSGNIVPVTGARFSDGDTTSGGLIATNCSPGISFINAFAAANPSYDRIVVVTDMQGSQGLVNGYFSADPADFPNRLVANKDRFNAAVALLQSQGYIVTACGGVFANGEPDSDVSVPSLVTAKANAYADDHELLVAYIRANYTGSANVPIVVSQAKTDTETTADGLDCHAFGAAAAGIGFRVPRTWFADPIIDTGFGETANLPIQTLADNRHHDLNGVRTFGRLFHAALVKAATNTNPHAPYDSLPKAGNVQSRYDFRRGTSRDAVGPYHLSQLGAEPPRIRHNTNFSTRVFNRPSGTNRVYSRAQPLPPQYTIAMRLSVDSINTTMGLLMNTDSGTGVAQRFFLSSGGNVVAGNAGVSTLSVAHGLSIGVPALLSLTYDGTTLSAYRNGTLLQSAASAGPDQTRGLYLGCQTAAFANPFLGDMQSCLIFNTALTAAELLAYANATYTR